VQVSLDDDARAWLAKRGYDPRMGARPMARLIQEQIKRPLAEELLFGVLAEGGQVRVSVAADGQSLALQCQPATKPALTAG
jgi:ATP-dependent Clp protease ATP-binding subunit ClpA